MKFLNTRNITVGIVALGIGILAVFGIAKAFGSSTESVTGNVAAFILNAEGKVDGANRIAADFGISRNQPFD